MSSKPSWPLDMDKLFETTGSSLLDQSDSASLNHYFAEHAMKIQGDIHQYWGNQNSVYRDAFSFRLLLSHTSLYENNLY